MNKMTAVSDNANITNEHKYRKVHKGFSQAFLF